LPLKNIEKLDYFCGILFAMQHIATNKIDKSYFTVRDATKCNN